MVFLVFEFGTEALEMFDTSKIGTEPIDCGSSFELSRSMYLASRLHNARYLTRKLSKFQVVCTHRLFAVKLEMS